MRTKEQALTEIKLRLADSERFITEYPESFDRWVSQAYGFVMGIAYAYPELDNQLMKIWDDWRRKVFQQRFISK